MNALKQNISFFVLLYQLQLHIFNVKGFDLVYVLISPNGTHEVSVGDKIKVTCRGYNMGDNVKTVIYRDDRNIYYENSSTATTTFTIPHGFNATSVVCIIYYNVNSLTKHEQSDTLTLLLKNRTKRNEVTLITKPVLSNVTHYKIGDRFTYVCTAINEDVITTVSWIRRKGTESQAVSAAVTSSVIDIVIDGSYNNTELRCEASYLKNKKFSIADVVTTKLILQKFPSGMVPWYIIIVAVGAILTVAAFVGWLYRYTKGKSEKIDYTVEVYNDLYDA